MAYSIDNLAPIKVGNSDSGRLWMYSEAATLAVMRASGYFDSASAAGLGDGDILILVGSDGFGMNDIVVTGTTYTVGEAITSV